jgi:transposase
LFSYVSIEERIPASHPLRRIRKLADQALDRLNPTFCRLYASEGRPSAPPEQLLLASPLQAFYGIRSEEAAAGATPLQPAVPLVCGHQPG